MNTNMMTGKTSLCQHSLLTTVTVMLCVLLGSPSLSSSIVAMAAPVPTGSSNATNGTLTDPFSTPDYLAPSEFTWEQCIYGIMFVSFGLVEVLHGYKYIRFTMLIAGFMVWSSTAVMITLITNINTGIYHSTGAYFAIWLVIGLAGAVLSFYLWHVGIILIGAYGMFVVVAVIFTAANVTNYVFRYTVLAICVVAGGYLTKRYERYAVIIATSLGGAYCIMFGLDMFVQAGFRATFHVMLSQSTASFYPIPGTWVMIACVPIITILGIIWELKRHETPVGSWWLGHGARPLPPLPGMKAPRKCCGFITMALSKKAAKQAKEAKEAAETGSNIENGGVTGGGPGAGTRNDSDDTLVASSTLPTKTDQKADSTTRTGLFWCCGRSRVKSGAKKVQMGTTSVGMDASRSTEAMTVVMATDSAASPESQIEEKSKEAATSAGPTGGSSSGNGGDPDRFAAEKAYFETIGHTGVRKVVIQREVREFSLEVDEKL